MIYSDFLHRLTFIFWVGSLPGRLHDFCSTWLRCNPLEWNDHSASLRLALYTKNRTLYPVQLPDLGSISVLALMLAHFSNSPYLVLSRKQQLNAKNRNNPFIGEHEIFRDYFS
jgi:hypothetical protein